MKDITFYLFFALIIILISSCNEHSTIVQNTSNRQLVLISDYAENSDMIIRILGAINSNNPDF